MHKMFIILLILIPAISFSQDDPRDILQNSYNILNKKKSVAYKATLRVKFFSGTDTSTHKAYVCLERQPADSIFGARVFLKFGNDWNKIYDLKNVYVLEIKTKKGMRYEPKHNWAIEGNINAGVIWRDFIHPDNILFRLDTANRLKLAGDTLINKTMCWKITINYPDEDEYSDQKRIMCVSKKEYVCLFTSFQTKFQGNYEYNALSLSSVEFDKQNVKEISERIVKEYKVEPYREPTPEEQAEMYRLLDTTSMAPVLKGKIYGSAEPISEIDYKGKVTMLDFWYMACGWCIKSFPYVEKLREKYGDKLTIYGINSYDNNEKSIAKIPKFLEFNSMKYPTVLVDKAFVESCKVRVWPTFYLVGPDGKVKFAQAGAIVDEKAMDIWEKEIEKLIAK